MDSLFSISFNSVLTGLHTQQKAEEPGRDLKKAGNVRLPCFLTERSNIVHDFSLETNTEHIREEKSLSLPALFPPFEIEL